MKALAAALACYAFVHGGPDDPHILIEPPAPGVRLCVYARETATAPWQFFMSTADYRMPGPLCRAVWPAWEYSRVDGPAHEFCPGVPGDPLPLEVRGLP